MGEAATVISFIAAFWFGQKSAGQGMAVVVWVGGFYAIIRANYLSVFTYFMFDAAVLGIYMARFSEMAAVHRHSEGARRWALAILMWPLFYLGVGFIFPHHVLVQLVGLRAAIWFVPFILIGTQMTGNDIKVFTTAVALLNLATLVFAIGELFLGVEMFYPRNASTELIYQSNDVAGYTAYRIPATFTHSATYGGYLVAGFPLLIARFVSRGLSSFEKLLMVAAMLAAMLGVFMCGSRSPVVILALMLIGAGILLRKRPEVLLLMVVCIAAVIYQVAQDERLQRVTSLTDTDAAVGRVTGGLSLSLLDVIADHPFGVGLGGAYGTSIPSFLQQYAPVPVGAENEYARIALEQSIVGVCLWVGFVGWIMVKRWTQRGSLLLTMLTFLTLFTWTMAYLGSGMLAAIPGTSMMLLYMGICAVNREPAGDARRPKANPLESRQSRPVRSGHF